MPTPLQTSEATEQVVPPAGVVGTLGLKSDVFIAQLVNFLIILFVLWRWAYKPLLKVLEDRQVKVKKGLDDAHTATERLGVIEQEHAAVLVKARTEASTLIKEAHDAAEHKREELLGKSRDEISKLITEARKKIAEERDQARVELKKEIAALVVATAELVLKEKLDPSRDAELMEKSVKKAPKKKELAK